MKHLIAALILLLSPLDALAAAGGLGHNGLDVTGIPRPAIEVGYKTLTFSSNFTGDVDNQSGAPTPGKKWYMYDWFGAGVSNPAKLDLTTPGQVRLLGDVTGPGGQLITMSGRSSTNCGTVGNPTPCGSTGYAFGGGWYVEVEASFDATTVPSYEEGGGWPAIWANPIEHHFGTDTWPGQASAGGYPYENYVENDLMEYIWHTPGSRISTYDATLHQWYGAYTNTCSPAAFCHVDNTANQFNYIPVGTVANFNVRHKYGQLWVPATPTTPGYIQNYFDRQPVGGRTTWTYFDGTGSQVPPVTNQSWKFGVIDRWHLALILGTGLGYSNAGAGNPFIIYDVKVWQKDATQNLIR